LLPGEVWELQIRLTHLKKTHPFESFQTLLELRKSEADRFYSAVQPDHLDGDERRVHRQALAGLLWSRQYYRYDVENWLQGDPTAPPPPASRLQGRNHRWRQLDAGDVIVMPDAWEYPWFAAWDLAFHCVSLSLVDPSFAKSQLLLLLREYYMHPNGQIPAYEWAFDDVNPPVTAWAALHIYRQEKSSTGKGDTAFLERVFQKLLLNFTWWVNCLDREGDNLFEGGFLGLDNISLIDRSALADGRMEQADASAWVATFCANMMAIAIELASVDPPYEDLAVKFLDHYMYIARAMMNPQQISPTLEPLWDDRDRFFYDHLYPGGQREDIPLRIRSLVGLIPLLAVETIEAGTLAKLPRFAEHWNWLLQNRPELLQNLAPLDKPGPCGRYLLSMFKEDMLRDVLQVALDENRMLSAFGLRSLSKEHREHPFSALIDGQWLTIAYAPGEAEVSLKGGNSNWRGPVWVPANYLIIQALLKFQEYHGDALRVKQTSADGQIRDLSLAQAAQELTTRLLGLFLLNRDDRRAYQGGDDLFASPGWRDTLLFHEYFHADSGQGLGASHQTGWTSLVANLLQDGQG
jgi:hypothetical protein